MQEDPSLTRAGKDLEETLKALNNNGEDIEQRPLKVLVKDLGKNLCCC